MQDNHFLKLIFEGREKKYAHFPDKQRAIKFIDDLFNFLFGSQTYKDKELRQFWKNLQIDLEQILHQISGKTAAKILARDFFNKLPIIHQRLQQDADSILQYDPAAKSIEEVIISYPGFYATAIYRISHELWLNELPILPRLISEYAHSKTGIDIHPGASIDVPFFIDHGTGVVIGETAVIGKNVKLYQGVTLGALNVSKDKAQHKRHPTIGDNVVIYSGATILGGDTIVGNDSIIGGNVWLTKSVESKSIVYHKSEVSIRNDFDFSVQVDFVI